MLAIICCNNWLGIGSLKEPALLYPALIKSRGDTFDMREKFCQYCLFAFDQERIIHRSVVAQIDKMASTILGRCTKVSVLNQTGKGITCITNVDPIAVGELTVQGQNQAVCAICLSPVIALPIILW